MANCLFECLREARLEKYHRNFVNGGLRHCEALIHLSMQEYPKYGVVSMEDRLKLFKLIQIVKSVQAEGLVCQHGKHTHAKQGHVTSDSRNNNVNKRQTNVIKITTNNGRHGPNRRQLPQAPHQVVQQDVPALRRSASMRQVPQPDAPSLRRSGSMHQSNHTNAPTSRRSASATRVEYKPNSDSPIFNCRRQLKFTDSDLESDDDDFPTAQHTKTTPANTMDTLSDQQREKEPFSNGLKIQSNFYNENSVVEKDSQRDKLQANISKPVRATSIFSTKTEYGKPFHTVTEPKVRSFNLETDVKPEDSPDDLLRHAIKNGTQPSPFEPSRKKITNDVVTSSGAAMVDIEPRKSAFTSNIKSKIVAKTSTEDEHVNTAHKQLQNQPRLSDPITAPQQTIQSSISLNVNGPTTMQVQTVPHFTSAFHSVQPTNVPSQSINYHTMQQTGVNMQPNSVPLTIASTQQKVALPGYVTQGSGVQPFQFKNFIPSNAIAHGQHSYFPATVSHPFNQKSSVDKIYYGTGYNYGVPTSTDYEPQNVLVKKVEQTSSANTIRNDKIRVCVRKRPLLNNEVQRGEVDIVKTDGINMITVEECKLAVDLSKFVQQHIFKFDEVFHPDCGNDVVYKRSVKPLVQFAFNKGTATCFAFGQTGSGKSYTLLGNQNVAGLYQLAAHDIFAGFMSWKNKTNTQLHLWVSYYEIYCSQLYDLLNKKKKLYVRENSRGKVCIAGLMETEVHNVKGLVEVVQYGNAARSTGVSGANAQSSRSHAILQLEVRDEKDIKQGRMSFIDLAGSERATDMPDTDRQTRIEGAEINQSLLALKECIRSIDQDSSHTPYRQSKLTHILRDSFLGHSQTVMIANIAPCFSSSENTLNTLRYADRVKELEKNPQRQSPKASMQGKRSKPSTPRLSSTNREAAVPKIKTPNTNTRQTQEAANKRPERPLSARKMAPDSGTIEYKSKPQVTAMLKATEVSKDIKPPSVHDLAAKAGAVNITENPRSNNSTQQQAAKHVNQNSTTLPRTQHAAPANKPPKPVELNANKLLTQQPKEKINMPSSRVMNNPFMPQNGMYSSTPKKGSGSPKTMDPLSSPFDVSKILKDEPETPLRGHKIQKNKALEESPEIIPAGKVQPKLNRFENPPPSSEKKGTIVEDIMESEPDASPLCTSDQKKIIDNDPKTDIHSKTNSQIADAAQCAGSKPNSQLNGQSYAPENESSHFQKGIHHGNESDGKIHVNAERVSELDDLIKHQRSALLSDNATSGVARRPLSAGRQRSRSRSPTAGRVHQERGRTEMRGYPAQKTSRSPASERQNRMNELSQRSKSIESLRASLKQKELSKSTPFLNELPSSPGNNKPRDFEQARYRSRSIESSRPREASKDSWSPRTNHANLRSQVAASVSASSLHNQSTSSDQNRKPSVDSRLHSMDGSRSSNFVIKSHDEIITEHREVLDHLDSLLDRAKAAVDSPEDKIVPVVNITDDSDRPLKSILKNSGHAQPQIKKIDVPNSTAQPPIDGSPKLNIKGYMSADHNIHDIREPLIINDNGARARLSDPIASLGPDVRPKEYPNRYSLSSQKTPTSIQPNREEFLKSLADIKHIQQRHSIGSSGDRSRSSSKGNTPGEHQPNSGHSSKGNTPGDHRFSSGHSSRGNTPGEHRLSSGHSSAVRTPSTGIALNGSGFITPAASAGLFGYVSGNDVVVITDQDPAFTGSPVPQGGYMPPPAPRKTNVCVNRSVNDLGFKGELERLERCNSQNSDHGSIRNRSWHDILSQSDDDVSLSDKKSRVSRQGSREGSLEMNLNEGVKQIATIKDVDTVVIETIESTNGRSTVDSGIGTHRDQSDPEADRRTNSRGSHYSLDLHSDHDTADDGISLSTDNTSNVPVKSRVHVVDNQVHRIEQKAKIRTTKSVPKRQLSPGEDDDYIPPLKLNFDEDDDDELEESYCRIVESEKRREAEERAKKRLQVHQTSAFTAVAEPQQNNGTTHIHSNVQQPHAAHFNGSQQASVQQRTEQGKGSDFSPIQSFPITPRDGHVVNAPTAMNRTNEVTKSQSVSSHDSNSTTNNGPTVRVIKHEHNTEQSSKARERIQTSRSSIDSSRPVQQTIHHGATSQAFESLPVHSQPTSARSTHGRSAEFQPVSARSTDGRPLVAQSGDGLKSHIVEASLDLQSLQASSTGQHTQLQQQLLASHEEQLAQMTSLCKQEMKLLMTIKASNQDFTSYVKGLEEILSDKGRCILHLKAKIDEYLNTTQQ